VGGAYARVEEARDAMTAVKERVYYPEPNAAAVYKRLFKLYSDVHDAFGDPKWSGSLAHVMKDLIAIRREVRG
jgi:L-ribulokinase